MAATIPLGGADIEANINLAGLSASVSEDRYAIGDLTLAPLLLYWNRGNFYYSLAEYIVTPTADYDLDRLVNSGLNYWTFETDFTISYFNATTGQDYSAVIGYNYNTENHD